MDGSPDRGSPEKRIAELYRAIGAAKSSGEPAPVGAAGLPHEILDALPAHVALLDARGHIVAVNESWRRFASANAMSGSDFGVGRDYLAVCEGASGECADEAFEAAAGIRRVLRGEASQFTIEYPCHSPQTPRWFQLAVAPVHTSNGAGAVVMHTDITERRLAEEAHVQSEHEQRALAGQLERERARLLEAQAVAKVGSWETDLATLEVRWSAETFRIFELDPASFRPTHQAFLERVHPDDRAAVDEAFVGSAGLDRACSVEHRILMPDGRIKFVEERWRAFRDADGVPVRAVGTCHDITERRLAEQQAERAARSLAGLVAIQHRMTSGERTLSEIMHIVTEGARELTGATACFVELVEDDAIVPRYAAGIALPGETVRLDMRKSLSGQAIESGTVLYCRDAGTDPRVSFEACRRYGVQSMVAAPLRTTSGTVGVLKLLSGVKDAFTEQDVSHLHLLAEMLASVIVARRAGEQLRQSEAQYRLLFHNNPHPMWVYDLETLQLLAVNEAAVRHYGYSEAEFLGMHASDFAMEPEGPAAAAARRVEMGRVVTLVKHRKRSGERLDVEITREGIELAGRPASLVLAHDVTERERAAEAVNRSVEELRTFAEAVPQIVWIGSSDARNFYFNQRWTDYTGLSLEVSRGRGWRGSVHPDDVRGAWQAWKHAVATSSAFSAPCRLRRADGAYRWWLVRALPQLDAAGTVLKWFGTCTDIQDLKEAELEVSRTNRALQMLSGSNEALVRAEGERELLEKICQVVVGIGGYRMAWVGYKRDDAARTVEPMAFAGEEAGYLSRLQVSWDESNPLGRGPGGRVIRSGQPVTARDLYADPAFTDWVDAARARGYRSVICLPLREGGAAFGFLAMYSAEVSDVTPAELLLLQQLADDLAYGIGSLRSRARQERIQKAVMRVAAGVSAGAGTAFFEQLALSMVEALGAHAGFVGQLLPGMPSRGRTLGAVADGRVIEGFEYDIQGTPCEGLLDADECIVLDEVTLRFPHAQRLAALSARAYVGQRLKDASGATVGMLFVLFREPLEEATLVTSTLQILAARAGAEIERLRADARVREQAALLDIAHEAIVVRDIEHRVLFWSRGAERMYGWSAEEATGRSILELFPNDPPRFLRAQAILLERGGWKGELHGHTKDGRPITIETRWTLVRDESGAPKSVLSMSFDVTEKKKLEEHVLRTQRIESLGTLAGGIAHDLNNMLAPIMMSIEMLKLKVTDAEGAELIETLRTSTRRGSDLVRQVLSFARGADGERVVVDLEAVADDLEKVVRDTFPKSIQFAVSLPADLWRVSGDPTQLHQVLLNLCVNARDAMPAGGALALRMANERLERPVPGMDPASVPGDFVVIRVVDNGTGIPESIRERIFDPFFTTKPVGQGTGLGLSTSLGIVRRHGGLMQVSSEPGRGTAFTIHLPAVRAATAAPAAAKAEPTMARGHGELVLVADDEEPIRKLVKTTLELYGYRVLTAGNGAEALALFVQRPSEFSAVMTDIAMPEMDGPRLAAAIREVRPELPVIGSSGLETAESVAEAGIRHFMPKPYTAEAMLALLRAVLSQGSPKA